MLAGMFEFLKSRKFHAVVNWFDAFIIAIIASLVQWLIAFSFVGFIPDGFLMSSIPVLGVIFSAMVGYFWLRAPGSDDLVSEIEDYLSEELSDYEYDLTNR